ncbi:hypothetical protein [Schlesneria sp.]|uniref:hypothetical protein n=1 Tax=Schlesneria sp. TaxID=2762018 RepID=UPI002EE8401A
MALTTLASVKAQGGILPGDTSRDAQLRILIDGVTSYVKQLLNRDLESQEYVEYYSGNGTPVLMLNQYPVTAVSLVCVDESGNFGAGPNSFPPTLNLVNGVDYALMSGAKGNGSAGFLRRIGAHWLRPLSRQNGVLGTLPGAAGGNIKVQYTAGYLDIPPAISMAVNALVLKQASMAAMGGAVASMSYEDVRVSYFDSHDARQVLGSIESVLATYRSIPV